MRFKKDKYMSKEIWKFKLAVKNKQFVTMPIGAEILSVQAQGALPCLWVLVDPKAPTEERCFEIFGTGNPIYYDMGMERIFKGTFQLLQGDFVGHLFERVN